uniref:Uncharacterized protein n=1 Tax=Sipha flava TaxID=143950 RepID=A0A2S2R6K6_9HEMI
MTFCLANKPHAHSPTARTAYYTPPVLYTSLCTCACVYVCVCVCVCVCVLFACFINGSVCRAKYYLRNRFSFVLHNRGPRPARPIIFFVRRRFDSGTRLHCSQRITVTRPRS